MLSYVKRFIGDSFLYALMSVGTKLIAFIMFPLYTHLLPPAEFGVVGILDRATAILTFLIIFGTDTAIAYFYFEAKEPEKKLMYVQNVMGFRLLVAVLFTVLILLMGTQVAELLKIPNYQWAIYYSMFFLILDTINTLVLTVYRFEGQTIRVVVITLLKMLLMAILSYVFLAYIDRSAEGMFLGRLLSIIVIVLISGKQMLSFLKIRLDKNILRELLSYGAPLVPASLALWVIASSNSYFILALEPNTQRALSQVGIFESAFRFASVISLLTYGIQMAWRPYSMQMKEHENGKEVFAKIYIAIFVIGIVGIMLVTFLMPWVVLLLDESYQISFQYVGFLAFGSFLNFYYLVISSGLLFTKQTKVISIAFGIGSAITVILNLILYPLFQLWGVIIANLSTYVVSVGLIFYKSQQAYYVPVSIRKLCFLFVQTVIAMAGLVYLQTHSDFSMWYQGIPWLYFFLSLAVCRIDRDFRQMKLR